MDRQRVLSELVKTEADFCKDLRLAIDVSGPTPSSMQLCCTAATHNNN